MTPERCVGILEAETKQGNTKERLKDVAMVGWFATSVAGVAAVAFSEQLHLHPVVVEVGGGIFLVNILASGVTMIGKTIKDIVKPTVRT